MRLLVCGSRDYTRQVQFENTMALLFEEGIELVIHGAAPGADRMADEWARFMGIEVLRFPANWKRYGKRAGYVRNKLMLTAKPDRVVAFFQGHTSKGTEMMVKLARDAGIDVWEIRNGS